jgi:hypothetical protein
VSCSPNYSVQDALGSDNYTKEKMDYLALDKNIRQELGISLYVSPNKNSFFILDPISDFIKICLVENKSQEVVIYNYSEIHGESAIRDMDEILVFWGGMSDKIYLYRPFSSKPELSVYMLNTQKWENIDISFMKEYKIQKAINQTNCLLAVKDGHYYSVNMIDKQSQKLSIPANSFIGDQNMQEVLFTNIEVINTSEYNCRLGVYDLDKDVVNYVDTKYPISRDYPLAYFVPNTAEDISYLSEFVDKDGYLSSYLEIYNLSSGLIKSIYIGDGPQTFLGWDIKGQAFYGTDYIMKK